MTLNQHFKHAFIGEKSFTIEKSYHKQLNTLIQIFFVNVYLYDNTILIFLFISVITISL